MTAISNKVATFAKDVDDIHQYLHGAADEVVQTESGPLKTLAGVNAQITEQAPAPSGDQIAFRASESPNVYGNAGIIDRLNADKELWNVWCFGDSRTEGIISSKFVAGAPEGTPLGGLALFGNPNNVAGFDSDNQNRPAGDGIPTSPYLGVVSNPITYREFRTKAEATDQNNALTNRLTFSPSVLNYGTVLLSRLAARPVRARVLMRRSAAAWASSTHWPYGNTMAALYLQARKESATEYDDPEYLRSSPLPIYNADAPEFVPAGLTIPAGKNWTDYNPDIGYICEPGVTQTVAGKVACGSDPWLELPTGILMRETGCVAGRSVFALLNEEVTPVGTFKAAKACGGKHALWVAIGTNNPQVQNTAQFQTSLQSFIEKFRAEVPDGPVILVTSYPAGGDSGTQYYVQAARNIANADRNVVCIDTYAAMPSYSAGVASGYYGDDTHYNDTGQTAYAAAYWNLWGAA